MGASSFPRAEMEILDLDEAKDKPEVREALSRYFDESIAGAARVNITKKFLWTKGICGSKERVSREATS